MEAIEGSRLPPAAVARLPPAVSEDAPNSSIAREIVAGLAAAAIALVCLLPPLLHLVTGPLGPVIGGAVAGYHLRPAARGRIVVAVTLGLSLAALIGGVVLVVFGALESEHKPDWLPPLDSIGLILSGVFAYATALGFAGVALGARIKGGAT